ncbi:MauE/DoxX family redox-associated membrane protein [Micromonospora sp. NPDC005237]|uniref:MauE/DoxX family redox-associated membrane protein n=1 Tax=Micromonospora sp. NPDC005237 TaxID=3155113 RepID=UPI0033A58E0E
MIDATVRIVAAAVLLYTAGQKLAAPITFRRTLVALRMPRPRVLALLVSGVELVTAVLLLTAPRAWVTAGLVIALGASFAGAASIALARGASVRCACFGGTSEAKLGWTQLALLPIWLAVAWTAHRDSSDLLVGPDAVAVTALVLCLATVVRQLLPLALRSWSYLKVLESQWASSGSSSPH